MPKKISYLLLLLPLLSISLVLFLFTNQFQLHLNLRVEIIFFGICFITFFAVLLTRFYLFSQINKLLNKYLSLNKLGQNNTHLINNSTSTTNSLSKVMITISSLIEENDQLSNKIAEFSNQVMNSQHEGEQDLKFHYISYLISKCRGITNSMVQQEPKTSKYCTALNLTLNEILKILNQEKAEIPDPCPQVSDLYYHQSSSPKASSNSSRENFSPFLSALAEIFEGQPSSLQKFSPPLLVDYLAIFHRCGDSDRRLKMILKLFSDNLEDVLSTVEHTINLSNSSNEASQALHKLKGFLLESGCIFEASITENLELEYETTQVEDRHKQFELVQNRVRKLKSLIDPILSL